MLSITQLLLSIKKEEKSWKLQLTCTKSKKFLLKKKLGINNLFYFLTEQTKLNSHCLSSILTVSIKSTMCFNLHKNYYSHLFWVISNSLITRACSALDFSSLLLLLLISSILLARITPTLQIKLTWYERPEMDNSRGGGVIVQRLLIFYYHWKENFKKKKLFTHKRQIQSWVLRE